MFQKIVASLVETPPLFLGRPTAEIDCAVEFEPYKSCKQPCIEISPEPWVIPGEDVVPVMVLPEPRVNQIGNLAWVPTKSKHRNGQPAYASRLKEEVIWVLEYVSYTRWKIDT